MPTLLWTGKISLPLRLMLNMGNMIAWMTGQDLKNMELVVQLFT